MESCLQNTATSCDRPVEVMADANEAPEAPPAPVDTKPQKKRSPLLGQLGHGPCMDCSRALQLYLDRTDAWDTETHILISNIYIYI